MRRELAIRIEENERVARREGVTRSAAEQEMVETLRSLGYLP